MKLRSVHVGDLVLVDDGLASYGKVTDKQNRALMVKPLCGDQPPRPVRARDVREHYRRLTV